jgi:hypothetical protein
MDAAQIDTRTLLGGSLIVLAALLAATGSARQGSP